MKVVGTTGLTNLISLIKSNFINKLDVVTPSAIEVYTQNEINAKLDTKQDKLISGTTIKTVGNQSLLGSGNIDISGLGGKITNCLTEIPQDIKLELNDGTLTLKADSKVYVPNGEDVFDAVTIQNDISVSISSFTGFLFYRTDNGNLHLELSQTISGTTPPSGDGTWYDTNTNKIKRYEDSTFVTDGLSFPLCHISSANVDQVFNGFGYIGSTIFALPGVKGLIPNGRNEDSSLRNTEVEITSVKTQTFSSNLTLDVVYGAGISDITANGQYEYNEQHNYNYDGSIVWSRFCYAIGSLTNGTITSFTPKTTFHAVDWDDCVHKTGDETIYGTKTFVSPISGTAMSAYWGDLAEYYLSDNEYPKGTLVQFGGEKEITIAKSEINAIITSQPGLIMNNEMSNGQAIALVGRVPVRVIGKVNKFDKLVLSEIPGVACVGTDNSFGRALEDKDSDEEGLVLAIVKLTL